MKATITKTLKALGIPVSITGFHYLREAVMYRINAGYINRVRVGNDKMYEDLFGCTIEADGHIKNGVFINTVAEYCEGCINEG